MGSMTMMMGMQLFGINMATEAVLLVALALGYVVFYFANQEEKRLKMLGHIIGGFVMALSIILIIASVTMNVKMYLHAKSNIPMQMMRQMQPPPPPGMGMPPSQSRDR